MKKRSLVLITVDCLRADHVGFQGYSRPVTPFLDFLAKSSVVFSNAIVAGVPTYFSVPAILASRYPLALGRDVLGIAPGEPTLATELRNSGCATAAFLAGNPYLSPRFGYDQGFDTFHDFLDAGGCEKSAAPLASEIEPSELNRRVQHAARRTHATAAMYDELYFWYCQWRASRESLAMEQLRRYPAADIMVDHARSWLSAVGDKPFFLWIHFMDPHHPHYPPQEALSALGLSTITPPYARFLNSFWNRREIGPRRLQRYRKHVLSLYDAGVYWVDRQISRLVSALQQLQRWDETVFVLTADHGEEFLEHGVRYHSPANLPEQLIHVPLLLRAPAIAGVCISDVPFSLIHLAPSLLEALGVGVPDSFQGRSHWQQISAGTGPSEPAIAEAVGSGDNPLERDDRMQPRVLAVRSHQFKLVIRFKEKTDALFDLKNDPGERSPLQDDVLIKERVRLLEAARAHVQESRQSRNVEFELAARLRELRHSRILPAKQ